MVLHDRIIIKLDGQKIKKISNTALQTSISQIISQNFCRNFINPEELELLEYALIMTFSTENR